MKYCITIERTQRVAIWFDATDDMNAEDKADNIYYSIRDNEFESGDTEYDYALDREDGKTIFGWK